MNKFLLTSLLILLPVNTYACGCSKPRSADDVRYASLIFRGRVVAVVETSTHRELHEHAGRPRTIPSSQTVLFEVLEQSSGPILKQVHIRFNESGFNSCDLESLSFAPGDEFLLSAKLNAPSPGPTGTIDDPFSNNYCDLRERT
jgi:hypothetical protein